MRQGYRPEIDGLRAVAVLAVLSFHFGIPGFGGGFVGVDVFFVISGFLITGIIRADCETNTFSFLAFYTRRVRRIFPALFVTVAVSFLIGAVLMSPWAFQRLSLTSITALLSFSNITFWLQSDYFDASKWTKPLLHTWSLGVEEQFYFLWPAILVLLLAKSPRRLIPFWILAIGAVSLIAAEIAVRHSPTAAFYLLPFRVCEFMVGAILVWARPYNSYRTIDEAGFLLGVAGILASIIFIDAKTPFPGVTAMLPAVSTAVCIYFGKALTAQLLLGNNLAAAAGRLSYSLYLTHWPIVVFAKYFLLRELSGIETALGIGASFISAILLHRLVERPFRERSGYPSASASSVAKCVTIAIAAVSIPAGTAQIDGWVWRVGGKPEYASRFRYHNAFYGGVGCSNQPCETQSGSDLPVVFVIGDSHARGLNAGLAKGFPEANFIIYGPNACTFFSPDYTTGDPRFRGRCHAAREQAFARIREASAPVILFQFWSYYAALPYTTKDGLKTFQSNSPEQYAQFVANQIISLKASLRIDRLVVVGGVPTFSGLGSPLDCLSRPLQRQACSSSQRDTQVDRTHDRFNAAMAKLAIGSFEWVNPFDSFCDKDACSNLTTNGEVIYSDADHLSAKGGEYFIGQIKPRLSKYLISK